MDFHIATSASFLWSLKLYVKENKKRKNTFIYFQDNLCFWPIKNIFEKDFLQKRSKFFYEILDFKEKFLYWKREFKYKKDDPFVEWKDYLIIEENFLYERYKNFLENIEKIKENDKVFIYLEHNSKDYIFLSYFLNIYKNDNFKVYFLEKNKTKNFENWVKLKLELWILNSTDLKDIFKNGKILEKKEKDFFKNIIKNISKNNSLKVLKYWKIKEIWIDFFDEKILKIAKNDFEHWIKFLWNCILKLNNYKIWEDFISFRISELKKEKKLIFDHKIEEYKHFHYKKMIKENFYYIKKNLWK